MQDNLPEFLHGPSGPEFASQDRVPPQESYFEPIDFERALGLDVRPSTETEAEADAETEDAATALDSAVADVFEHLLGQNLPLPEARKRLVAAFEQRYIERALGRHNGNVSQAAAASGVGSRYFRLLRARNRDRGGATC